MTPITREQLRALIPSYHYGYSDYVLSSTKVDAIVDVILPLLEAQQAEIERTRLELALLGQAIGEELVVAGVMANVPATGPELLGVLQGFGDFVLQQQAEIERLTKLALIDRDCRDDLRAEIEKLRALIVKDADNISHNHGGWQDNPATCLKCAALEALDARND